MSYGRQRTRCHVTHTAGTKMQLSVRTEEPAIRIKAKRKQFRGRFTRMITRAENLSLMVAKAEDVSEEKRSEDAKGLSFGL